MKCPANFVQGCYIFLGGSLVDAVISEETTVHMFDSKCSTTLITSLFRLVENLFMLYVSSEESFGLHNCFKGENYLFFCSICSQLWIISISLFVTFKYYRRYSSPPAQCLHHQLGQTVEWGFSPE